MAVRNISEAKKQKKTKLRKYHIIVLCLAIFLTSIVIAKSASNYAQAADYNRQASEIEASAVSVSEESSDIMETLKPENHEAYFERIAREEYGYCKPGEKVFYNSSFGE